MSPTDILAQLRVTMPDGTDDIVPVTGAEFNIGRVQENELKLSGGMVSRHHARLLFEGDRVSLIDLKSSNGTMVGDIKLPPNEPYPISYGEAFQVGPFILHLEPVTTPADQKESGEADVSVSPPELAPVPHVKLGVTDAPPPPPPTGPVPVTAEEPRPPYGDIFGLLPDQSRYLRHLPPIYAEHPFLGRFLLAFEEVLTPIEQTVDNFNLYLDPGTAPDFFLEQLAAWLGLTLDEKWPSEKRRTVVAEAAELYRQRGTRRGLSRHLEIYTDIVPEIIEPDDHPHHFRVILRVPAGLDMDRATVDRIIRAGKPAHTTYTLEILQEK
jgi:phage tail-like protein